MTIIWTDANWFFPIVICQITVYGNLVVGPSAENIEEREKPDPNPTILQKLKEYAESIVPELKNHKPIGSIVGLRPATKQKDYHLYASSSRYI